MGGQRGVVVTRLI